MRKCRLSVQTSEGVWQGEVDSWTSLVVLAALSAEPESFAELAAAVRRYQPEHRLFDRHRRTTAGVEVETGGLWCLVDLTGRTVVASAEFELPDPQGAYEATEDDNADGFPVVWLDTPEDWLFQVAGANWPTVVATRAATRAAVPRLDVRPVLFGTPLLERLAAGVLKHASNSLDEEKQREWTRGIHAEWLLSERADLGGRTPRDLLLAEQRHINRDLDHRCEQWSRQRFAPPALPADSPAYLLGGFGIVEVVLYFDLVRAMLAVAWHVTRQEPQPKQLLVEQLAAFRDYWLGQPDEGGSSLLSPAELIESERRRMPVTSHGSPLDDDCPICQAMATDEFGPAFLCFDGHHLELEDEFAFSLCRTRAEWDQQQEEFRQMAEKMDRNRSDSSASEGAFPGTVSDSAWQTSFVDWDVFAGPDASPRQALLALGFPLAELTSHLQQRPDGTDLMKLLNKSYGELRASQDAVATASATEELRELIEAVSERFPDLTARCADLQSRLDEVLRRLS